MFAQFWFLCIKIYALADRTLGNTSLTTCQSIISSPLLHPGPEADLKKGLAVGNWLS
jgi:hypothetical protein